MLKDVNCNLCGKDHYAVLYKSEGHASEYNQAYLISERDLIMPERIVKCLVCGLIYANPRQSSKELISAYVGMVDEDYVKEEEGRRQSARIILKRLKAFKKRGRLLDIGSAAGFLLDEAKKQTWEVYGVELSKWGAEYAKKNFDIDIFCSSLKTSGFKNNFFDAVVLQDTIEHLTNPKDTLIEIRRVLKPDGILCISTPDIDSLISKLLKGRWWGINQAHLFYFTKKSLYKMLDATGFTPLKDRRHPRTFSFRYWVLRVENYNKFLHRVLQFFVDKLSLGKKLVTINTADQIEVYARRSRKLKYIEEFEERPKEAASKDTKTKVIAVLPAYNAEKTLRKTVADIPRGAVDEIILVDDGSKDNTAKVARELGLKVFVHKRNMGYGGNQKTCYQKALEAGADIIIMVHPDYQYDPRAIPSLIEPIKKGEADAVFGSRMMKGGALIGGMPLWKHNANIILTAVENVIFGTYLTEYHSGFRAYNSKVLKAIRFMDNSDDFVFDTEIIAQMLLHYLKIEEVPIRTRYFDEASSITVWASLMYGFEILKTLIKFILHRNSIITFRQFE